jgi:hypothetical protein
VIVVAIFLILFALFIVNYWMTPLKPYGPPYSVSLGIVADYDEQVDTFTIYVDSSSADPQGLLKLNDVSVRLVDSHREIIREYMIVDIHGHVDLDITYFDNDDNELLTIGDEFSIDGSIVENSSEFWIIHSPYGKLLGNVDLN